jgi:hypothetical protein
MLHRSGITFPNRIKLLIGTLCALDPSRARREIGRCGARPGEIARVREEKAMRKHVDREIASLNQAIALSWGMGLVSVAVGLTALISAVLRLGVL